MEKLNNSEFKKAENIESTIKNAKHLLEVKNNFYKMIEFCKENKILIRNSEEVQEVEMLDSSEKELINLNEKIANNEITDFDYSNQAGSLKMQIINLASKYESGQKKIAKNLTAEQANQIYNEKIK
jgi:hypothetical protein